LAFTIAAEIGEIERFASPEKLTGYTGLCPRVNQSGDKDRRGPLSKHGPRYPRWALLEATMHALKHPRSTSFDFHRHHPSSAYRDRESMRLALIASLLPPDTRGGAEQYPVAVARSLARSHEVVLLTGSRALSPDGLPVVRLPGLPLLPPGSPLPRRILWHARDQWLPAVHLSLSRRAGGKPRIPCKSSTAQYRAAQAETAAEYRKDMTRGRARSNRG
jgi:hypothetical protein